ncbi:hypothetical protein ACJX0J_038960, partial [Zea mays]
ADGSVRAEGHREAAGSGAGAAGEEAGQRHAPLHAGAPGGAVPAAGTAHAGPPAPRPPPPDASQTTPVAAAPEAPPLLRDGPVVRGQRQDRGGGRGRARAAGRGGEGQAALRRRPVLPGAVAGGDGAAEPAGVQRPLRRPLGGQHGAEQPAAGAGGLLPGLHGQHGVVPRQGAVPERAPPAHRRAGAAAQPQEAGDAAQGRRQDALAALVVAGRQLLLPVVVVGCQARRLRRVAQGQRVRLHQLRAHRRHPLQPDAVARRLR